MKLEELVGKSITEAQFDEAAGKKDACYHKVKARYDVWPSAYASGALVKCRKAGAKNWGNKSKKEGMDEADLGLTYKRGTTVKVKHKKSGKTLVIVDKPVVKKEYEKIGYYEVKPIRLRSKSGMGKISHLGIESVDEKVNLKGRRNNNLLLRFGVNEKDLALLLKKN